MIKRLFSWMDPYILFGSKSELENLIESPLQNNETLRLDEQGCFHRLKVPSDQADMWNKAIFWTHIYFNKKSHLPAIDRLILLFEQHVMSRPVLIHSEYQEIMQQIECLRSLKNDYGFTTLGEGNPEEVEEKLLGIEKQAYIIFENYIQQLAIEEENERKETFFNFLKETQDALSLLCKESWFGLQEARHLLTAYEDDIPALLGERLHNLEARLLLTQDINDEIEEMDNLHRGKFTVPDIDMQLNSLRNKLDLEINNLEKEIEILIENLINYYFDHQEFGIMHDYLEQIGVDFAQKKDTFTYDKEKTIGEKIQLIQEHLNKLAA